MAGNTLWQIAFGDYDFALDRRTLTYQLTDTKTGAVWADRLSVGWLTLEEAATGKQTRYAFGDMKLVSLSEKSGQQGKRILIGLDCQGVPVDLYFICSQKEIQLTVEASRDTRTHRVQDIGLLPGLVSVPDDGVSYLVIPQREGAILRAADGPAAMRSLPIWDSPRGVTMPFIGAVQSRTFSEPDSALALITDSVYGAFHLARREDGSATLDTRYTRDPERRRLDLRLMVLPEQNHAGVARAYRSKIIGERSHVTLRQKIREQPRTESLLGAAWFLLSAAQSAEASDIARRWKQELGVERAVWWLSSPPDRPLPEGHLLLHEATRRSQEGDREATGHEVCFFESHFPLDGLGKETAWSILETGLEDIAKVRESFAVVGSADGSDWRNLAADYWLPSKAPVIPADDVETIAVPLYPAVYHDSLVVPHPILASHQTSFLRALRNLAPPLYDLRTSESTDTFVERTYAVLGPLHHLSFAAFLNEHRFLTPDFTVEEARYTNGASVLINQSATETYENEQVSLPPFGFYVEHSRMTAHDALRVGVETFPKRAFRIARSQDSKPLSESADVLLQEFAN
ncbi:MAG: hypothetical protein H7Z41_15380 [Cytophagales bacterium]|nr:hypothetical protein [Armatimonadota bacterium]